jgi:GNAT superfamily N-acetyltransferase
MPEFRTDSLATPERRERVYALLDLAFPGIGECIPRMEPLAAAWHEVSTAFVLWEGDTPVAHVGVLEIDLVVEDQPLRAQGIHAVCTHPRYRGRGYARELLERALGFCDSRGERCLLFADVPALYEKFDFRTLPQTEFSTGVGPVANHGPGFRPIDPQRDLPLLRRMLGQREPVSHVLGCVRTEQLFFCNLVLKELGLERIYRAEGLDAFVVFGRQADALVLLDVVARELPTLEQVLERVGRIVGEVRFGFTPDRLGEIGSLRHRPLEGDVFMIRGRWPAVTRPFRYPLLARC